MSNAAPAPVRVPLKLRSFETELLLPPGSEVLRPSEPEPITDVPGAVAKALASPIGSAPLSELCREVSRGTKERAEIAQRAPAQRAPAGQGAATGAGPARPSAVVVISDNTRPVPYKGEDGILWPLVESLLSEGFPPDSITLLVATGMHRVLSDEEMWSLVDERIRLAGVRVRCHDSTDPQTLTFVGRTKGGDDVLIDSAYVDADLRILTGLVEVHLMAGVSGGRKSICPGLLGVKSVREFHGPLAVAHPKAKGLVLEGNPCHAVALEIARMARPDIILNVTMRQDGRVVGVFAGDLEEAHAAAVAHLRSFITIPLRQEYDVVVVHGGAVGVNHYQAEKAVEVASRAVREQGYLILVADTTDPDPVGSPSYRELLRLLKDIGADAFIERLQSKEWDFVPDQWGAQVWAQLLHSIPAEHIFYYSPQTPLSDYSLLPSVDPRPLLTDTAGAGAAEVTRQFVAAAIDRACRESEAATGRKAKVAYLADGPHGIPARNCRAED